MSDTPRTDSMRGFHDLDTAVDAEFSEQLERELNESNKIIRQQQLLDEKNLMLEERIKQLEELYEGEIGERPELLDSNVLGLLKRELNFAQKRIKRLEYAGGLALGYASKGDFESADKVWREAKEDKP